MRPRDVAFLLYALLTVLLVSVIPGTANPASTADLLQQSLAAMAGSLAVKDLTLNGSVNVTVGSHREAGTATLSSILSGPSKIDLNLYSGNRTEIINTDSVPPTGTWTGADGSVHFMASHNLWTTSSWFSPTIAIASGLSSSNVIVTYIGQETMNGAAVQHIILVRPSPVDDSPKYSRLTQLDFFLDIETLFPVALKFNTHPDDNLSIDIPVEIRFADYRSVQGAQIPFRIQKFINNVLTFDFEIQTATLNSGLSEAHLTQ